VRIKLNLILPGLAAAAIGGPIALPPIASADTDPLVDMAPIPKSHTCCCTTNRTTTKPTPRTANWTCPFNAQRAQVECPAVPGSA
jgi:hypothetical protein